MKNRHIFTEFIIVFCVITTAIIILETILGTVYLPNVTFGFEGYISPVLFGFLSAVITFIGKSSRELSVKEVIFREGIQLFLIEAMVFGVNYLAGNVFAKELNIALAISIALIYVIVYLILWLNDRRSAMIFNEELKKYQKMYGEGK